MGVRDASPENRATAQGEDNNWVQTTQSEGMRPSYKQLMRGDWNVLQAQRCPSSMSNQTGVILNGLSSAIEILALVYVAVIFGIKSNEKYRVSYYHYCHFGTKSYEQFLGVLATE